jgi:hypothetical protein
MVVFVAAAVVVILAAEWGMTVLVILPECPFLHPLSKFHCHFPEIFKIS